jgi:hypothetical protein
MVTDDLVVTPMPSYNAISLSDLDEQVVSIGQEEVSHWLIS